MFGFFKKEATPAEFGYAVLHTAVDFLSPDAGRSLGMRFNDFDGSHGWANFLERKGLPIERQKLYFCLFRALRHSGCLHSIRRRHQTGNDGRRNRWRLCEQAGWV